MEYRIVYERNPLPLEGLVLEEKRLIAALCRGDLSAPVIVRRPKGKSSFYVTPDGIIPVRHNDLRLVRDNEESDVDEGDLQVSDGKPERWLGINGFSKYEISTHGRVRGLWHGGRVLSYTRNGLLLRYTLTDDDGKVCNLCLQAILSLAEVME